MAWNPSKEVAVARDAAKALDNAPMCIVLWVTKDAKVGMATYGKTKELCRRAKEIGDVAWDAIMREET